MEKHTASSLAIKGLTGAVALAGATQTYGAVINVTAPPSLSATATTGTVFENFDVDNDGTPDFQLVAGLYPGAVAAYTGVYGFGGVGTAAFVGTYSTYGYNASKLAAGTVIGPNSAFVQNDYLTNFGLRESGANFVNTFASPGGYAGFEFTAADGDLHFGYISLISTLAGSTAANNTAMLTFGTVAYESTPNTPITIPSAAVPEPTSLAALAFGVVGAGGLALRRRKAAALLS